MQKAKNSPFNNFAVLDHPLIQHKLTIMRDRHTPTIQFRQLLREITLLMGYEITRSLPMMDIPIETPLMTMQAPTIAGKKIAVVPILRAGLVMADALLELIPSARIGHIGLYRDPKSHLPVEYYVKLPETDGRLFIVVDPMLATGNSAAAAVDLLNKHGVKDQQIRFLALVVAPEGIAVFHQKHPHVRVYAAALDQGLNDKAYIFPGLGDAGDRLFGTK